MLHALLRSAGPATVSFASAVRQLVTQAHVTAFKSFTSVLTAPDQVAPFNHDWMQKYVGRAELVLQPRSTSEVAQILKYCNEHELPVCPQGGNTGLVGGSVPVRDEIIVSLSKMNRILDFQEGGALVCEAGCILQALEAHAAERGHMMPLDFGSKGSCQIGGNLATNAGGLRFLRYGSLRGSVLGLEAVLADGTVLDCLKTLRKDNTGYDLKQLFIGSEGTLGIITKVAIQCPTRPAAVNTVLLALPSFASVSAVYTTARRQLGEILSAFEFFDQQSIDLVLAHNAATRNPFGSELHDMYLLVETSGSNASHDREKLEAFMESCSESGSVVDAVYASDLTQADNIWRIREGISESLQKHGSTYKYDLSVPMASMYEVVERLKSDLADLDGVVVTGYGHVGDGNLHLNISDAARRPDKVVRSRLEPFVYEWTRSHRGSVSAEHGLGVMKNKYIHYSQSAEAIDVMQRLKRLLDPRCILNPHKCLPPDTADSG